MDAPNEETVVQPSNVPPSADPPASPSVVDPNETPEAKEARERDDKGRFRNPLQPRIDELTRDKHEARREADFWRQRAEALANPPQEPPAPAAKPTPDQFDSYDAFVEALTDWKADQKIDAKLAERDKTTAEKQTVEKRATNWQEREANIRKAVPDYDSVMQASSVPVSQAVTAELLDSERGPEIALHLAKNPDVAHKLNGLDEKALAREMGKLEATLPAVSATPPAEETQTDPLVPAADAPPATPPKKTTAAPPPTKPTGQGRATTTPLEKMGMDDYVKTRREQGAKWARR